MKLTRKILAAVTACAVTISFAAASALAATVIYDGTADLQAVPENPGCEFPAYNDDIGVEGAGRIAVAGGPHTFWDDGRGLGIANRQNGWDSIDVTLGGLDAGDYTMVVGFNATNDVTFTIEDADGPWAAHTDGDGNEAVLVFEFTLDDDSGVWNDQNRMRLKASDLDSFYVKSIVIYEGIGLDLDLSAVDTGWGAEEDAPMVGGDDAPLPPDLEDSGNGGDAGPVSDETDDAADAVAPTPPANNNTADDDGGNTMTIVLIVAGVLLLIIIIAVVAKKKA